MNEHKTERDLTKPKKAINRKVKSLIISTKTTPQPCLFSDDLSGSSRDDFDKIGFMDKLSKSLSIENADDSTCWNIDKIIELVSTIKVPLEIIAAIIKSAATLIK